MAAANGRIHAAPVRSGCEDSESREDSWTDRPSRLLRAGTARSPSVGGKCPDAPAANSPRIGCLRPSRTLLYLWRREFELETELPGVAFHRATLSHFSKVKLTSV